MSFLPDLDSFLQLARHHTLVPVYRRLASDLLTPVSAFHQLDSPHGACLFESVIGGEKVGRYSFLAADPYQTFCARGQCVTVRRGSGVEEFTDADPLSRLRDWLRHERAAHLDDLPPFVAGAVGYAGYDVVRYCESLPNAPDDDRGLPDLSFGFYDRMVIFDNINKTLVVVVMARTQGDPAADRQAYQSACQRVEETMGRLLQSPAGLQPAEIDLTDRRPVVVPARCNMEPEQFKGAVRRCVDYIRAGDIFQVVISQRWEVALAVPAFEIYRTLRMINPSPFMFYLRSPEVTLVGSSPEILCRVMDGRVTVRPLAGTRPRGESPADDQRLAAQLLEDPKEIAEHVMLVDLGRNDVGRVARFGSVELTDVMSIERYSHVMHITSNVTGQLQPALDAFDALRACLPAGTVSGAPKVRAMEIIDTLEPHRRGPYAGAVGYFDFTGNMDTCIALRTIVVQGNRAYVQAGAGIVADSHPDDEYQETCNKARGLLKAIELTEQRHRPSP